MISTIISIVVFILLTIELIFLIFQIFAKKREDRLNFIKGYNKGNCFVVYLTIIPLIMVGIVYSGADVIKAFFLSLANIIELIVMKFKFDYIQLQMQNNLIYTITIYYAYFLVCINTIMFILSFIGQFLFESYRSTAFKLSKENKLYIFGYSENNLTIYNSSKDKNKVIVDNLTSDDKFDLYLKKTFYISCKSPNGVVAQIIGDALKTPSAINVVINTGNDTENIKICNLFSEYVNSNGVRVRDLISKLNIYLYGNPSLENLYTEFENKMCGILRFVNKYQLIANDLIKNYPLARLLDESQVDYNTGTLKSGVDISVNLVGFGGTGIEIFLTSLVNNQFIAKDGEKTVAKLVKYNIFDKNAGETSQLLNQNYFRYLSEYKSYNKDDYLPFPDFPESHSIYKVDFNSLEFYANLEKETKKVKNGLNVVVITHGTDIENVDMAKKIKQKMIEWGACNPYVFVKAKEDVSCMLTSGEDNIIVFGNEEEIVYNIDKVIDKSMTNMAIERNTIYSLGFMQWRENAISKTDYYKMLEQSKYIWYTSVNSLNKDSTYSSCLSIRGKLNLMGFDVIEKSSDIEGVSESEFVDFYSQNDAIDYDLYNLELKGKKLIHYSVESLNYSLRQNMAILEHLRWNAFMLTKGFVPATINEILTDKNDKGYTNGKSYKQRKHGNLTTFEGLMKFSELISQRDNKPLAETDVIRYDYQLLDEAFWILDKTGYKIIRKQK